MAIQFFYSGLDGYSFHTFNSTKSVSGWIQSFQGYLWKLRRSKKKKKKTKKNLTQQLTFVISPCTIHNEYNNNDDENHTPDNASNNGASIFVTRRWCRCWGYKWNDNTSNVTTSDCCYYCLLNHSLIFLFCYPSF